MPYGGTRNYKLYTWWRRDTNNHASTRSYKTKEAVLATYDALTPSEQRNTDVWYEPNKQTPKKFIIKMGRKI